MCGNTLSYASAGHVPGLLATPESAPKLLTDARSVPLAVNRDDPRPQAAAAVAAGSTLLLYTDGLVERRAEPIDAGIARVAEVLAQTSWLESKVSEGGTSLARVREQLAAAGAVLDESA